MSESQQTLGQNGYPQSKSCSKESSGATPKQRWKAHLDSELVHLPLLACCFCTGLLDTTMFQAYGTFVSMQTGNTIFLALGASNQNIKPYDWARSLCSIGCFIIGAFFFSRLNRRLGSKIPQRGPLALSFFLQAALVFVAAILVQVGAVNQRQSDNGVTDWREIAPIALLSFQAAGQIVASRVLGVNEVPTVVITSLLADLFSDPNLTAKPILTGNRKRNNRVVGFVLTLVASIAGGWILKGTGQVQPVLWLVFGIKAVIGLAWLIWKEDDTKQNTV
ncbi:hypothetical protein N0V93_007431 [Gnomoniopsis smithogilvyi]|uniref:DUF1275 domain protein n=1 Tax=Gnomoniopsis smithogilvyi TaxID=1191159 RepID=A0A9W9CVD3_9PEZI|nr:hypothetical protein N0V93_007431 [Gnomoniopsis smithogilvyi]